MERSKGKCLAKREHKNRERFSFPEQKRVDSKRLCSSSFFLFVAHCFCKIARDSFESSQTKDFKSVIKDDCAFFDGRSEYILFFSKRSNTFKPKFPCLQAIDWDFYGKILGSSKRSFPGRGKMRKEKENSWKGSRKLYDTQPDSLFCHHCSL